MQTVDAASRGGTAPLGLLSRAIGVLTAPRRTFEAVMLRPRWLGMLALTVGTAALCQGLLFSTEAGQTALLDQQVRTRESFGYIVDDELYDELEQENEDAAVTIAAWTLTLAPATSLAIAGLLFVGFRRANPQATYRQVYAVVVHSGVVLALQQIVVTPLNYVRESISSPTNLAIFFPMLEEGTLPARFSGMVDLFLIWWIVVLSIGIGVVHRRPARRVATVLFAVYGGLALALAVIMAIVGGS